MASVRALPLAQANPQISLDVIANLPVALQQRSDLYIDPSITSRTPLITADGQPLEGQTLDKMAAARVCGSDMAAVGGWSNPFPSNCGVMGSPGTTVTYTFSTKQNTSGTQGCFQAKGYKPIMQVPTTIITGYSEYWLGRGCSDGYITVDWGNVAAVPAGKIAPMGIGAVAGSYSH